MKKKFIAVSLVTLSFLLIGVPNVSAKEKMTNFKETVDEEISTFESNSDAKEFVDTMKNADFTGYKEDDPNKINVYIFRGSTCGYCLKAVSFFSSIIKDYGKYFNLKTYEVWNNQDNSELFSKVASVLGDSADGVPYIVIGDKSFSGYASSMDNDIEKQIKAEYDKKKSERYDVMDHLDKAKATTSDDTSSDDTTAKKTSKSSSLSVTDFWFIIIVIILADIIYTELRVRSVKKYAEKEINEIKKASKKAEEPVKKAVKKVQEKPKKKSVKK